MIIDPVVLALTVIWAIAFAAGAGWLASQRDRSIPIWIAFGAILGPFALFLLWIAPPGRCSHCLAPVHGWLTTCEWCGMDVRPTRDLVGASGSETGSGRTRRPPMASPAPAKPIITVASVRRPTEEPQRPVAITAGMVATPLPNGGGETAAVASPAEATATLAVSTNGKGPAPGALDAKTSAVTTTSAVQPKKAPARTRTKPAAPTPTVPVEMQTITSGIFVTGTVGLTPGSRYTIRRGGDQLQVLGPTDKSPKKIAFERQLAGTDATAPEGRLILSAQGSRGGTVLVFMGVDGDPAVVADAVNRAASLGVPS